MKKDGLDIGICDDTRSDWLAKELREENYHGCMDHGGQHAEGRADNRGWAAKRAKREGYRECDLHERRHFRESAGENQKNPVQVIGLAVGIIIVVNVLVNLLLMADL